MVVPFVLPSYLLRNTNTNNKDNIFSNCLSGVVSGGGMEEEGYLVLCPEVVPILYNFYGFVLVLYYPSPATMRLNLVDNWLSQLWSPLDLNPDLPEGLPVSQR